MRIEDYAIIGSADTAALVGRDGSIDWFCAPRFDSAAMFAALLGDRDNGRWCVRPADDAARSTRRYRDATLVLETEFETSAGSVRVIDFMPRDGEQVDIVRIVEGISGHVEMESDLTIRYDYGERVPWVTAYDNGIMAVAGPDAVALHTTMGAEGRDLSTHTSFSVSAGERVPFVLTWFPSHLDPPEPVEPFKALDDTERWWREWSDRCTFKGPWREAVVRSLITLKALTYEPTGGIVAAPTTSLPEEIGGERNWDYRFCWLRDATFTLQALLGGGYQREAAEWRDWLLRAVAGEPSKIQVLYGMAGETRITESTLDWLAGYEGSRPVRIGNGAVEQLQLDVFGEIFDVLHVARRKGIPPSDAGWRLQRHLIEYVAEKWREPDSGIWEVRSDPQHFTHSRVMAWVAVDRAIDSVERLGLDGDLDRWKRLRNEIHDDVTQNGYDPERNTFVRAYGSSTLDASLLLIPLVGFLPPSDERVRGTVSAVANELMHHGFLRRYDTGSPDADGVAGDEGAFIPCTFWLADAYAQDGQREEARRIFERMLEIRNDVGLLAEEYDPVARRQLGNFPQAFSHIALVNSASNLGPAGKGSTAERTQSQ